ncbi:major facilitator family transporter [Fusarium denticulatum]|uniref:Major facilitator family transporter n=1 Tax=Fusarium denticulatum TaxID=48507 RepID=A0A8H5UMX4_9HYPO|nr:major facilitator family transporter [Fusarium denticulatum]
MPFHDGEFGLLYMNRDRFDFNLHFEQLFFSILPCTLFIVCSLWRAITLSRKPLVVHAPIFQLIKLGAIITYVGLHIALLIQVGMDSFHAPPIFIASSVLNLVAALAMVMISYTDHNRSPRPSILLNTFLFLTLLFDIAQSRTLFLLSESTPEITYSAVFTTSLAVKAVILFLETKSKNKWLQWDRDEHSPEETSSIFSLGVLSWLNSIFLQGYRSTLSMDDLYPLDVALHSKQLHDRFLANMDYSKLKGDSYGLVKVLVKTLIVPLLLPIPLRLALLGFTFCQPFFIEKLLDHLSQPEVEANVGYGFIGAAILIYLGMAVSAALCWYLHHRMRAMTRSILVTEIFSRATQARIGADDHNAALTLMSTDIERIRLGLRMLHNVWAGVIQAALAAWMLYIRLGLVFLVPIGVVVRAWMTGVQKRVGLTATVIAGMKNLKLSGLASTVSSFVQKLRVEELAAGARFRKIFIVAAMLGFTPMLISPPLTLAFTRASLDTSKVFTSLAFLMLLTNPLSQIFTSIPELVSGIACIGRIQTFLECETRHDFRQVLSDRKKNLSFTEIEANTGSSEIETTSDSTMISIKNGCFGWKENVFVLQDINARIEKSSLTMVVGPVGSGKSTFCKTLLGEIPLSQGSVVLSMRYPRIGFCDQTAFLWNGTIRDNILGFSLYDEKRYNSIIQATALSVDFAKLAQGDQTNVGSDGITLSGGQKQRVSLARALYLESDLVILDDVFSGLDADTELHVFQRVFGPGGLLRERCTTVVLCTHSVRFLPFSDHVIALGDNTIKEQGSFKELAEQGGYVKSLGIRDSAEGDGSEAVSETEAPKEQTEAQTDAQSSPDGSPTAKVSLDDPNRATGDKAVYKYYFMSMGILVAFCCFFLAALWGFFTNFPTIWIKFWTDDISSDTRSHSHAYYVGIYTSLQVSALISLLLLGITLFIVSIKRAGANLHHDTLATLIQAPLSFFTQTDTGVITNLFSQDLNLIDTELPDALLNTLFCVFQALGQAAVMPISSAYLAISYPFLAVILYSVQKFYLRTSRQLRLLDLEAKSPLYTHFMDTVRGITTLRAFGYISDEVSKNARLLNRSQQPAYLLAMVQEWLNLVLDMVVMLLAAVLTILAVRLHSNSGFTGASLVTLMSFGESLSGIVIYYTRLETSIGAISRLKTFNATVKPEGKEGEDMVPPENWPQHGSVELNNVSASYQIENSSDGEPDLALDNVCLSIKPGEKVAICGRTGSGKSSLVSLLLKLLDPLPDTPNEVLLIDGLPLNRLDRDTLRQRVIAVPQEAVFLPDGATFKENLDPSGLSTPDECKSILIDIGLWDFVQSRGGIDAGMTSSTLSGGQRQLMSMGRSLLRRRARVQKSTGPGNVAEKMEDQGGLLLLDEVNSSVDQDMELIIKRIIETEFDAYTVIAVSHRLDMIMDFDTVVVLDTGKLVEVGNPRALAGTEGGRFASLVRAGGK